MIKFYLYRIFLIFFFLSSGSAYSNDKIFFIDLDFVLKNSIIGKDTLKKIENLNNKNIQELQKNESILKNLDNNIKAKKNIISKEEFDKELIILKEEINKYKNLKDKMVIDYGKQKNNNIKKFFEKINPIIKDYMNNNSIDILLESKIVFIGKNNLDITKIIIQEIDKKLN